MTLNLFRHLMPREESFTALFCEQTRCIVAAAQELRRMINTGGSNDIHVTTIRSLELEADEFAKKVFVAANRTFNAPIDREDILALAHDLDDAVDLIEDTAKGIQRYGVQEFPAEMRAMADAVVRSAEVLQEVMPLLDAITQQHKTIFSLCEKIGRIEGEADECFDAGLSRLRVQLRKGEIDTIAYIDRKELYELLEEVVDKCDDVANALQSVTAKHV
jgi:predicted phosphate transport protein (TIGR00153 family)